MKKMHRTIVWLTVLCLMLALAGCGGQEPTTEPTTVPTTAPTEPPITAEQVFSSLSDAIENVEATRMRMELAYDMTVTEGEGEEAVTTEITLDMVVDTMACQEPFGGYTLMDMSLVSGDYDMAYVIELYLVEEEDSVVGYMQMFDSWIRSNYEMSVSEFLTSGQMTEVDTEEVWSGIAKLADMTLDDETQNLNGTEVYILRGTIPAGDMSEALSSLGVEDPSAYADLTLPVVYYVDTESFLIVRMEADMSYMKDVLDEVIAQAMVGTEATNATIELDISNVIYDLEYGVPAIPPVPQEAYDYIANNPDTSGGEEDTEPTVYDGPLVLNCGSESLLVTCPEGWTGEINDATNVTIYDETYELFGDYYYFDTLTREDVLNLAQIDADYLESIDALVSQGESIAMEGYETWQVIGQEQSYYLAWREAGDGWILVYIYDFTGTDDATELLPQFVGYLSPYTE